MVYLVHFDEKLHHAQHYIGYADEENILLRMHRHRLGNGSKILNACNRAGVTYFVARTWPGATRHFERSLKKRKNSKKLCPVCRFGKGNGNDGRKVR